MSDLFGDEPLFEEEVTPVESFDSTTTVIPSKAYGEKTEAIPLFTHEAPVIPPNDLNVDLSGNEAMQSVEDILAGLKNDE